MNCCAKGFIIFDTVLHLFGILEGATIVKMFTKAAVLPALLLSLTFVPGLRAHADNIAEVATKAGSFKTCSVWSKSPA